MVTWFLLPNVARAEAPHYRVELSVPPSLPDCKREMDLNGMLLPMLDGPLLEPPAERVIMVRIAKTPAIYRLDVVVKDLDGQMLEEERIDLPANMSCFEVLYRGALRAAVQMNKGVKPAKAEQAQCPAAPPPPPPSPPPPAAPPGARSETRPPPSQPAPFERWFVGLGGFVSLGAAPATVVGLQLAGGWRWAPSWSIEANVRGTFPTDALLEGVTPVRALARIRDRRAVLSIEARWRVRTDVGE
ncbi:MAG: hypothetical protein IPM54_25400 [Polyangiaceae bacterium]|nr:hypothetical protein [Polyangiaceae bacterium]